MAQLVDRKLFGPGPSNPYPEATAAFAQPLLGHLDPEFLRVMDETCDMLRTVWGTRNQRTLPLSATGSAGMEAAFVNIVGEGDVVVVAVNGLFGERMCEVASPLRRRGRPGPARVGYAGRRRPGALRAPQPEGDRRRARGDLHRGPLGHRRPRCGQG